MAHLTVLEILWFRMLVDDELSLIVRCVNRLKTLDLTGKAFEL